jgi:quercetin dioxygenase-like cupin family protein
VITNQLVPPIADSALALASVELGADEVTAIAEDESDSLLYVVRGRGSLALADAVFELDAGGAGLVLAGEEAGIAAGEEGLALLHATVAPAADRHAPLGSREMVVLPTAETERATGARSFRVLFGPQNGSTRATLFAGFVPPGRAPWHYHLYDEIVWVPEGQALVHRDGETTEHGAESAFRLRPREVHIVENPSLDRDLTILGIFTPAGSPSAAYLPADVAAEHGVLI